MLLVFGNQVRKLNRLAGDPAVDPAPQQTHMSFGAREA